MKFNLINFKKGAMERSQKEAKVSELRSIFNNMSLECWLITEELKPTGSGTAKQLMIIFTMKVLKNSLARIAAEDTPFSELADHSHKLVR
ncbi:MAG: hypothetical protein Ct9H300mP21_04360 [Pseudomonadota bacterium]|nr:MAG: hypothetical protein Ct9H300mP21_04360 [Pseudomonadota bacterium]